MTKTSLGLHIQPELENYMLRAGEVILPFNVSHNNDYTYLGEEKDDFFVGVDLGTAYISLVVIDSHRNPITGTYQFAQFVRDGLVVDYIGAVDLLTLMKKTVEDQLGQRLKYAATAYPPGVPAAEVRATSNVVEAAGFWCSGMIDEPSAANLVMEMDNTAVVDVGGGTTGVAVVKDGNVLHAVDEATGGTHFTLTIAGALDIPFEEAENLKVNPNQQKRLFPIVRPVMEKVGSIINRSIEGFQVESITLVGGTSAFTGIDRVISDYTGLPVLIPKNPMFVTPLGIARHDLAQRI